MKRFATKKIDRKRKLLWAAFVYVSRVLFLFFFWGGGLGGSGCSLRVFHWRVFYCNLKVTSPELF